MLAVSLRIEEGQKLLSPRFNIKFGINIEKRGEQLQSLYDISISNRRRKTTSNSRQESEDDSGVEEIYKSDDKTLEETDNNENQDNNNKDSLSDGTIENKVLLTINVALFMLDVDIIEPLFTSNYLSASHL